MRNWGIVWLLGAAAAVHAQVPVEDGRARQDTLQRDQYKAGATYRELQQAEYASRQAEQDFRQADNDYQAAQARAEEFRKQYDLMKKKLDAAKSREAQLRKSYEAALNAVDADARKPAKK